MFYILTWKVLNPDSLGFYPITVYSPTTYHWTNRSQLEVNKNMNICCKFLISGCLLKGSQTYVDGVVWFTLKESEFYSLKHVELKIRPTYT